MKNSSDTPSFNSSNIPQKNKTIKKIKPTFKNQYDKNIVANITTMMIKNILSKQYEEEIQ